MLTVHMIGNAHLDPVWLWRWQQGADEALATFRSAADRCEEYPEFVYTRGWDGNASSFTGNAISRSVSALD